MASSNMQLETMGKRLDTLEEEIENLLKNITGDIQNPAIHCDQLPSVNLTLSPPDTMGKRLDAAEKTLEEIKDMMKNNIEIPSSPPAPKVRPSSDVEAYHGEYDSIFLLDWLALMDASFARYNVAEEWRVALAISKLKGAAGFWWSSIEEPVRTWEDLKIRLKRRFLSPRQPISMERMRMSMERMRMSMEYDKTVEVCVEGFQYPQQHNLKSRLY